MKDLIGNEISVGDAVVLIQPSYRRLILARVVLIQESKTKTRAKVRFSEQWSTGIHYKELLQESDQLIKVDGPDALAYILKNPI